MILERYLEVMRWPSYIRSSHQSYRHFTFSGISSKIANISSWFKNVPSNSGNDGTFLIDKIIKQSNNYLNESGLLFFPVISLSNKKKILQTAEKNFSFVRLLSRNEWPLPEELSKYINLLNELKEKNYIELNIKFGIPICYTEIYVAHNNG